MWLLFALGSAFFAGITAVLAKLGIHGHDSTLVTALRTSVVFLGAWIVAAISIKGHFASELTAITPRTYLFLFLSGLATGASWLCFFAALSRAPVTVVSPIDKSSTIIAIAFAVFFLGERLSPIACVGVLALTAGIGLTLEQGMLSGLFSQHTKRPANAPLPDAQKASTASWMIFALASAIFAALTSILGKVGITGVDSNLGTAIRTSVVLLMAWIVVALHAKPAQIRTEQREVSEQAQEELMRQLGFFGGLWGKRLLQELVFFLRARENLDFLAQRRVDGLRRKVVRLGEQLVRQGELAEAQDLFYLHREELGRAFAGEIERAAFLRSLPPRV